MMQEINIHIGNRDVNRVEQVENKAVQAARREGVQVKLFSVIYELLAQVEEAMLGMLDLAVGCSHR